MVDIRIAKRGIRVAIQEVEAIDVQLKRIRRRSAVLFRQMSLIPRDGNHRKVDAKLLSSADANSVPDKSVAWTRSDNQSAYLYGGRVGPCENIW